MTTRRASTGFALFLAGIIVAAGVTAAVLFPRSFPTVVLEGRISRQAALERAESFFREHELAAPGTRRAVQFGSDESLLTFVDLAGGGRDTLESLVRGRDVALYTWSVRAFTPKDAHEASVHFSPDGRVVGFARHLPESDARPALTPDSAQRVAELVVTGWLGESMARWHLATSSYDTKKTSGRIDRTFTFERTERKIAGAPIRLEITIAGDLPTHARSFVVVPESFTRRYDEMRSANDLISSIDGVGILIVGVLGVFALRRFARTRQVRWRPALIAGAVIGGLVLAAGLNDLPGAWFGYDTATSPGVYTAMIVGSAVGVALFTMLLVGLTLAAAEAAARTAFPQSLDWWRLWTYRGTRDVAGRVLGGYTVAAIALAYVTVFYLITRHAFGWWVPAELLDDPNQIATPAPWIAGIALSAQAGVWEEALFRALPLSLLAMWVGDRPRRNWWMAGGVVVTALIFGFAHASYASWPPYSRGVEILIDACFWGFLVLRFGVLVTIIGHFLYDLTLFGLFAAAGTALPYRITAGFILLALAAPAIAVVWRWIQQRGLVDAPPEARFAAWSPSVPVAQEELPVDTARSALGDRARPFAIPIIAAAVLAAIGAPRSGVRGPPFTMARERVVATADSVLRAARGQDPTQWRRLSATVTESHGALTRFLREQHSESLATTLATTYAIPAWWMVRYVHTAGSLATRTEEWRVRMRPDGVPIDVRHVVPDSAPGATPADDDARRIAYAALAAAHIDTARLVEAKLVDTARAARHDITITYTDTGTHLPGGAVARVWVALAGDEPVVVRRAVELPETFQREDRDRLTMRVVIMGTLGLAFAAFIIIAAVVVVRRRRPIVVDSPGRRLILWGLAVLAVVSIADGLNTLPGQFAQYDTAVPWSTFMSSTSVELVFSLVPVLLFGGLWLVVDALRRRIGVPLVPRVSSTTIRGDNVIPGVALGALFAIVQLVRHFNAPDIPSPPSTALDTAMPWLSGVLSVPTTVLAMVSVLAITVLPLVGLTARRARRIALVVVLVALVETVVFVAGDVPVHAGTIVGGVLGPLAFGLALWAWGAISVSAWFIAAFTTSALMDLHGSLHAATGVEQAGAAASFALAAAAVLWIARRTSASPASSGGDLA